MNIDEAAKILRSAYYDILSTSRRAIIELKLTPKSCS